MVRGSLICEPINFLRGKLLAVEPNVGLGRTTGVFIGGKTSSYAVSISTNTVNTGLSDQAVRAPIVATVLLDNTATELRRFS